jgi:hypothetical protein
MKPSTAGGPTSSRRKGNRPTESSSRDRKLAVSADGLCGKNSGQSGGGSGGLTPNTSLRFHSVKKRSESGVSEVAESIGPETNAIDALVVYLQSTVIFPS